MGRLRFIHLSGPRRGEADTVVRLPATIGSDPEADVRVPGTARCHALVLRDEENIVLQDAGDASGVLLAGEHVREALLRDGDVVELGRGGPKLRFRREGERRVGLLQALRWARPVGARLHVADTQAFVRVLAHETLVRTSRAFRLALAAVLIAGGAGLVWSYRESRRLSAEVRKLEAALHAAEQDRRAFQARIEQERQRAEQERREAETRAEEYRRREEELRGRLAEATSGEVLALRQDLGQARVRLQTLEGERAAGERIIREYGAGVCLVQGSYAFYDGEARPLRVNLDDSGRPQREPDGSLQVTADGSGPIHSVDYFGTGFLADRSGLILTNRHVAEPWTSDESAAALDEAGFRPRFLVFRAFFPREAEPFELEPVSSSDGVDLALLRIALGGRKIPVLPLDAGGRGAVPGQPAIVVGYPTGLEAILAKADAGVVREILASHGTSPQRVAEALARRGLIRPSTTQGHIGDITKTDIVFDAPTTVGGSGGPVFNQAGVVVAVEYAVLQKFGGNSFGVPVRYAQDLLRAARRKKP